MRFRVAASVMLTGEASTEATLPRASKTEEKATIVAIVEVDTWALGEGGGDLLPRDSHSPYIRRAQDFDIDIASSCGFPVQGMY
jgi:hypothetical protein